MKTVNCSAMGGAERQEWKDEENNFHEIERWNGAIWLPTFLI